MYIFGADAPMNDTWDLESKAYVTGCFISLSILLLLLFLLLSLGFSLFLSVGVGSPHAPTVCLESP